jgi:hypothetical protein
LTNTPDCLFNHRVLNTAATRAFSALSAAGATGVVSFSPIVLFFAGGQTG